MSKDHSNETQTGEPIVDSYIQQVVHSSPSTDVADGARSDALPNAVIMGEIEVVELDGKNFKTEMGILLDFPNKESIRSAINEQRISFKVFGQMPPDETGPDFNQEVNLHADTIAERHDSGIPEEPKRYHAHIRLNSDETIYSPEGWVAGKAYDALERRLHSLEKDYDTVMAGYRRELEEAETRLREALAENEELRQLVQVKHQRAEAVTRQLEIAIAERAEAALSDSQVLPATAPRGNWNPNETPEELAERMKKVRAFVEAVNPGTPKSDALRNKGHVRVDEWITLCESLERDLALALAAVRDAPDRKGLDEWREKHSAIIQKAKK